MKEAQNPSVQLRPVDAASFATFREIAIADYAQACVRAGRWSPEDAEKNATADTRKLLKDGPNTKGHQIHHLVLDGADIGFIWWAPEPGRKDRAFVYLIYLYDQWRGRGLGAAAMATAETTIKDQGYDSVGLHTFTFNERAIRLYQSRGFETTDVVMVKALG